MNEAIFHTGAERGEFESWASNLAGELAAAIPGEDDEVASQGPVGFLTSQKALSAPDGERIPGFACGGDEGKNGEDLLYYVYARAWEDLDEVDCRLRVYSGYEPEMGEGYVLGLDLTERFACPSGNVIFLIDPLEIRGLVCNLPEELVRLWRAASRGVAPAGRSDGG